MWDIAKKHKTELMFVPSTTTIVRWRKGLPMLMDKVKGDDDSSLVGRKSKKTANLIEAHDSADENRDVVVDDKAGKFISTKKMCV